MQDANVQYIPLVNMMSHILFVLQGSQGFSGEPGIPGESGVGEPGPKVSLMV